VLQVLAENGVPASKPLWWEDDEAILGAAFMVMEGIEGEVPADFPNYRRDGFIADGTPEQRRRAWETALDAFAAISRVPVESVEFLAKPAQGSTGLEQDLEYWSETYEFTAHKSGIANPTVEAGLEWLRDNLPSHRPTALSWGDSRLGNVMFRDYECAALLDWEMVSLAGPMADLVWWMSFERNLDDFIGACPEGFKSWEATVPAWEERTGIKVGDLDWYWPYNEMRTSVLHQRLSDLQARSGRRRVSDPLDNMGTRRLAELLGLPAPIAFAGG
jgi:aminoglycoside phosphotransferase (APT) family kinase protein